MAIVTPPGSPSRLTSSRRQVNNPLHQLRGYIHRYVITEALSVLVITLAICFWLGLLSDYGTFRLFNLDWVQDLPRWFRALFLGAGLLVVAFVIELRKVLRVEPAPGKWTDKINQQTGVPGGGSGLVSILSYIFGPWVYQVLRHPALLAAFLIPLVVLYFAGWVTLALLLDRGTVAPVLVGSLVMMLLIGLIAAIVLKRLMYEFRDPALALVLERRFPGILEDRLITAVELSNPEEAARLGYSRVMVEETIHEAAERVAKLPLGEVFDWKRLRNQGLVALVLTLGVYLATFASVVGYQSSQGDNAGLGTFRQINRVAGIWMERNLLLDNERWPKKALIQPVAYSIDDRPLLPFPESGEIKVGKGSAKVDLVARCIEYAIHDRRVEDRWRALTLDDLRQRKRYRVTNIPDEKTLPADLTPRDPDLGITVDEVKFYLSRLQGKPGGNAPVVQQLKDVLARVDELTAQESNTRRLRKLILPEQVVVRYRGRSKQANVTLERQANNEYRGKLDDPSESVEFNFRAEDFISDTHRLTVVPPPRVEEMTSFTEAPAYLYFLAPPGDQVLSSLAASSVGLLSPVGHVLSAAACLPPERALDDDQELLAGKRQKIRSGVVGIATETNPRVQVPVGSDVTLVARTDKKLRDRESVKIGPANSAFLQSLKLEVDEDQQTFRVVVPRVRTPIEMRFDFVDEDGAVGAQELTLVPVNDERPELQQVKPLVVREVNGKFMITPEAIIPFALSARDEQGLARLDYVVRVEEASSGTEEGRRASLAAAAVALRGAGPGAGVLADLYLELLPGALRKTTAGVIEGRFSVPDFQVKIDARRNRSNPRAILAGLNSTLDGRKIADGNMERLYVFKELRDLDAYLTNLDADALDPEIEKVTVPYKGFDVKQLRRREAGGPEKYLRAGPEEVQRRYDMLLYVEARDTNVERVGRGVTQSQQYPFLIVSDTELLFQIGLEEQRLFDELKKMFDELEKARNEMSRLRFDLPATLSASAKLRDPFQPFSVQVEEIEKTLRESLRITGKVHDDYERILREMRTNRIHKGDKKQIAERVKDQIVIPLAKVRDGDFPYAQAASGGLRRTLDNASLPDTERLTRARQDAEAAEKELERVVAALREILVHMQGIIDINKVIERLRKLEQSEQEALTRIQAEKKRLEEELLKDIGIDGLK